LTDYEKIFCPDLKTPADIFDMRGIDRNAGALVAIRPDQFIADILPIDGFGALSRYFERFMRNQGEVAGYRVKTA
jgi:phenol 2-monooxygenase